MAERITFSGELRTDTEKARLLRSGTGAEIWLPKSVFSYWSCDASNHCKFRLDGFTFIKKAQAALFDEE